MLGLSTDPIAAPAPLPKPVRGRSLAAAALLLTHVPFSILAALSSGHRFHLAEQLSSGIDVPQEAAVFSDWALKVTATSGLLLFLPTATLFLLWFHRAHQNLSSFRRGPFEHSPRGAVASFFIPFLNLVQPYFVMKEIWQASDPAIPPFAQTPWPSARTSSLLGIWWAFFLLRGFAGSGVTIVSMTMKGIPALRYGAFGSLLIYLFAIPSAVAAAAIVIGIAKRQASLTAQLQGPLPRA